MQKYVISAVILGLGLGLIGWKFYLDKNILPNIADTNTSIIPETKVSTTTSTTIENTEKDKAWSVLQQYLTFAKNADLTGVASLSYQISDGCQKSISDPKTASSTGALAECKWRIKNVYDLGKQFKKASFTGILSDQKQIILYTDWTIMDGDVLAGFTRSIIYFIKDKSENLKLLSFNPSSGIFINKGTLKDEEITAKLKSKLKDSDQDGITDDVESCIEQDSTCFKTDPSKRDTDGDGYWDGVEALFYK